MYLLHTSVYSWTETWLLKESSWRQQDISDCTDWSHGREERRRIRAFDLSLFSYKKLVLSFLSTTWKWYQQAQTDFCTSWGVLMPWTSCGYSSSHAWKVRKCMSDDRGYSCVKCLHLMFPNTRNKSIITHPAKTIGWREIWLLGHTNVKQLVGESNYLE